jgi:hypothetical protein
MPNHRAQLPCTFLRFTENGVAEYQKKVEGVKTFWTPLYSGGKKVFGHTENFSKIVIHLHVFLKTV